MGFSSQALLTGHVRYGIHLLPEKHVAPIYNTCLASMLIAGGLETVIELPNGSKEPWRLEKEPVAADKKGRNHKGRTARTIHPSQKRLMLPADSDVADIWTLLGYLAEVGPVPATIAAPKPFPWKGDLYSAVWTDAFMQARLTWVLYLVRYNSSRSVSKRLVQHSHVLVSTAYH